MKIDLNRARLFIHYAFMCHVMCCLVALHFFMFVRTSSSRLVHPSPRQLPCQNNPMHQNQYQGAHLLILTLTPSRLSQVERQYRNNICCHRFVYATESRGALRGGRRDRYRFYVGNLIDYQADLVEEWKRESGTERRPRRSR